MGFRIRDVKGFAFDLDGTIWSGATLLPGAIELVEALRNAGRKVVFVSNNSRKLSCELSEQLSRLGIPTRPIEVLAAVELIGVAIHRQLGSVELLALGTGELHGVLERAGHRVLELDLWPRARAVAMGVDPEFNYARLQAASSAVGNGALLFAVNLDARFPVGPDRFDPGCGALAEAVAVAGGRRPISVGKPGRPLFEMALERLECQPGEAAMVGDSAAADIAGAAAVGMRTVWIINDAEPDVVITPDWSVADPAALLELWQADVERLGDGL
jgi:HAD superfamily hydrolase (TIGR01450 family)